MHSRFTRALVVCLTLPLAMYAVLSAVALSTTTAATQNFDGMGIPASATTASTLPLDFKVDNPTTVRTVGSFASAGTSAARAGGATLSTTAANGIYNFGAGTAPLGNSDRAVGFLSSGSATASGNLYALFTTTPAGALTGLQISYDVEKYRGGNERGWLLRSVVFVNRWRDVDERRRELLDFLWARRQQQRLRHRAGGHDISQPGAGSIDPQRQQLLLGLELFRLQRFHYDERAGARHRQYLCPRRVGWRIDEPRSHRRRQSVLGRRRKQRTPHRHRHARDESDEHRTRGHRKPVVDRRLRDAAVLRRRHQR